MHLPAKVFRWLALVCTKLDVNRCQLRYTPHVPAMYRSIVFQKRRGNFSPSGLHPGTTTLSFTSRGKSRACSLTCIQRNLQFFPWNTDCTDSTRKLPPALDYGKFWSKISPRWRGFIYECDNVERCCISALSTEIFFRMEVRTRVSPLFFIFIKHTYIRQRKR